MNEKKLLVGVGINDRGRPWQMVVSGATRRGLRRRLNRRGDRQRARRLSRLHRSVRDIARAATGGGFPGTDRHGAVELGNAGRAGYVESPPQIQATSHQLAGFYPWITAGNRPILGAPLGKHFIHATGVFLDLMTAYLSKGASSPSLIVFGLQGRGKSSIFLRMCLGMVDAGFLLVFPGDLKGEYTKLIEASGGTTIKLGPGFDAVNPMDAGPLEAMIAKISDRLLREQMEAEIRTRIHNTCIALLELTLNSKLEPRSGEKTVFTTAIDQARAEKKSEAVLGDVMERIQNPDEELMRASLCGTAEEFTALAKPLLHGLDDLLHGAEFGGTFSRQTTTHMPVGAHVSFDISAVPLSQARFRAALQVVTWSYSQAVTSAVMTLHEAGLWPEVHYVMGFDELWQVFQVNPRVAVYMLDDIIRINRSKGIGQALLTHGTGDLNLPDPDLADKARKFVSRSSMRIFTGLDHDEIDALEGYQKFTSVERAWLSAWAADSGYGSVPPGRGKFLIKFGDDAGTPVDMGAKTEYEESLHNTNEAFAGAMAAFAGRS
jgi:hypothetical protein